MSEAKPIIKKEDVLYDAILLDEKSVETLVNLTKSLGLDISTPQENMHMTTSFYDLDSIKKLTKAINKAEGEEKIELQEQLNQIIEAKQLQQFNNMELGTSVSLDVVELGVFYKDGQPMNVGVRINDKYFSDIDLGNGRTLEDAWSLKVPHVTIHVSENSKAVYTPKCFGEGLEPGETCKVFELESNLELHGEAMAFRFKNVTDELEGFPKNPEKHPEMSQDEISDSKDFYDELRKVQVKDSGFNL